jgi:hypothetical protein
MRECIKFYIKWLYFPMKISNEKKQPGYVPILRVGKNELTEIVSTVCFIIYNVD